MYNIDLIVAHELKYLNSVYFVVIIVYDNL